MAQIRWKQRKRRSRVGMQGGTLVRWWRRLGWRRGGGRRWRRSSWRMGLSERQSGGRKM
jgi:hypothetical protein